MAVGGSAGKARPRRPLVAAVGNAKQFASGRDMVVGQRHRRNIAVTSRRQRLCPAAADAMPGLHRLLVSAFDRDKAHAGPAHCFAISFATPQFGTSDAVGGGRSPFHCPTNCGLQPCPAISGG